MTNEKKYRVWNNVEQCYEEVSFAPYCDTSGAPPPKKEKKPLPRDWKRIQEYQRLEAKGLSHQKIADMYGLTRSAVSNTLRRYKKVNFPAPERQRTHEPPEPIKEEGPPKFRLVKRMRETLKIRDKDAQIVWFTPNLFQRELDAIVVICDKLGVPVVFWILKSRQKGYSTRIEGYIYVWSRDIPYTEALLAAHLKPNTQKVFRITKRFFDNDPEKDTIGAKFNREALEFPSGHGSRIDIVTAETEDSGASGTTNRIHNSEFGLFNKPADYWATLYPAWPKTAGSIIFNESTGRHDAVAFKESFDVGFRHDPEHPIKTYQHIRECRRLNVVAHISIFSSWLYDDADAIELEPDETLETLGMEWGDRKGLDDKERQLIEDFPILAEHPAKMKWLHQEYVGMQRNWARLMTEQPLDPKHPFLFYGGPFYDQVILTQLLNEANTTTPLFRGEIEFDPDFVIGKPKLSANPFGHLLIFEEPIPGCLYVIGLDCAQGTGSGDYNEIVVVRVPKPDEKRKVVAHWRTNERGVGPGMASVNAWLIAKYYGKLGNTPMIIPERQAVNVAAIEKLLEGHPYFPKMTAPYPLLFSYKQRDRDSGEEREEYGFQTTDTAKQSSIDRLAIEIGSGNYEIESPILIQQLIGFSEDPLKKGKNRYVQRFVDPDTKKPNDDGESALRMANYGIDWMLENDIPVLERITA